MNNKLTIKYSFILLAFFLIDFWLFNFYGIDIKESLTFYYPKELGENLQPFRVYNILFGIGITIIMIKCINRYYMENSKAKIIDATLFGIKTFALAEIVYQLISQITIGQGDMVSKVFYYFKAIVTTTLIFSFFCFFIAYQRKTRNNWMLALYIVVFLLLFNIIYKVIPSL